MSQHLSSERFSTSGYGGSQNAFTTNLRLHKADSPNDASKLARLNRHRCSMFSDPRIQPLQYQAVNKLVGSDHSVRPTAVRSSLIISDQSLEPALPARSANGVVSCTIADTKDYASSACRDPPSIQQMDNHTIDHNGDLFRVASNRQGDSPF